MSEPSLKQAKELLFDCMEGCDEPEFSSYSLALRVLSEESSKTIERQEQELAKAMHYKQALEDAKKHLEISSPTMAPYSGTYVIISNALDVYENQSEHCTPSPATQRALEEDLSKAKRYKNTDEMFEDLGINIKGTQKKESK